MFIIGDNRVVLNAILLSNSLAHSGSNQGVTNIFSFDFFLFFVSFPANFKKCISNQIYHAVQEL